MSREPLNYLLGMHVEVYSGGDAGRQPEHLMGEGTVVGIAYAPTLTIRHEDGTLSHHVATLPRIEHHVERRWVGCRP